MSNTKSSTLILNGKDVSDFICEGIKSEINKLKEKNKRVPGLAVILVGNNAASEAYVRNKEKKSKEIGLHSEVHHLPENSSEELIISKVEELNNKEIIDGIIIQLPLPNNKDSKNVINKLNPLKDVDGLTIFNSGKLFSGQKTLIPCTPKGIIKILEYYKIEITGRNAVVLGRSNLVGKPIAHLLLEKNATVTIAHSKTKSIESIAKTADILICAMGKPKIVNRSWVKDNATIIDVGINRISVDNKSKLVGDVDFEDVVNKCYAITPVPGGVGPMTVAMLIENTLEAYKNINLEN